jgi:hypothetical protein
LQREAASLLFLLLGDASGFTYSDNFKAAYLPFLLLGDASGFAHKVPTALIGQLYHASPITPEHWRLSLEESLGLTGGFFFFDPDRLIDSAKNEKKLANCLRVFACVNERG